MAIRRQHRRLSNRRVVAIATYYDLLGVAPDAPTSVIRDAYRRAARAHHPDRAGASSAARMAEVNRAWQVLGDPVARHAYDRSLRAPAAMPRAAAPTPDPVVLAPLPPARFPWKFMGVLAVGVLGFVVLGVATSSEQRPPAVDNLLQPGDCVIIEANGDAAERLCTEPHDGVVEVLVPAGETCPATAEPHRDQLGLGIACIRPG